MFAPSVRPQKCLTVDPGSGETPSFQLALELSPSRAHLKEPPRFDGATYESALDGTRLGRQLLAVRAAMQDGAWWTLARLAAHVTASEASVSARIRDLRKPRFGGHRVERKRIEGGLHAYRLVTGGEA